MEVNMPKFGLTMKKGRIAKWLKKEGDAVKKDEPIAEIMSEKITNVLESPGTGVLQKIIVPAGKSAPIGEVIAYLDAQDAGDDTEKAQKPQDTPDTQDSLEEAAQDEEDSKLIREVIPLSGLRKIIGERMSESLQQAPQGTMTTRADMSEVIALKNKYAAKGKKVSFTDLFIKIIAVALESNPVINSAIKDDNLIQYKSANIGVAVGTEDGLFVPVIKNVQDKSVVEISKELKDMVQKIKEGCISEEELTGSTFTISNMGMFDVDVITPIINPPEVAILAIGSTRKEVVANEDGSIAVKPLTTLSLTADHSAMDGIPAVKFFVTVKEIMNKPESYLG